jgi:hypothetical protein
MTKQEIHAQRAAALLILMAKMRAGGKVFA